MARSELCGTCGQPLDGQRCGECDTVVTRVDDGADEKTTVHYREKVDAALTPDEVAFANAAGCRLVRRLGWGGMGTVYQAVQISMDRPIALKVLDADLARDKAYLRRFLEEGRAAARLNHPNIVQVYDVGAVKSRPYLMMEYVDGLDLIDLLAAKTLTVAKLLKIAAGLARALAYAHGKEVVHRDLKPANVLVTDSFDVKLVDLGLARRRDRHSGLTRPGTMLGTPAYMAPEQARDPRTAGPAADVYGFGATLYMAVYGKPPFRGRNAVELVQRALRELPKFPRWPGVPERVVRLLQICLRKSPAERYPDGAALLANVERMQRRELPLDPCHRSEVPLMSSEAWRIGIAAVAILALLALALAVARCV